MSVMNLLTSPNQAPYAGDGVYLYRQPPTPIPASTVVSNSIGIYGGATWGKPNTQYPVSGPNPAGAYDALGRGEPGTFPMMLTFGAALELGTEFVLIRGTDGTDTAAQMAFPDGNGGTYFVLTAVCTGSRPNPATGAVAYGTVQLSPYSTTGTPLAKLTLYMPDGATQVFDQLPCGTPAAFIAAVVAAVNNGNASTGPSSYWVATAGTSAVALPFLGGTVSTFNVTVQGTDGANLTTAMAIGQAGFAPTGIQAFAGSGIAFLAVAECLDPSIIPTLDTFASQNLSFAIAMLGGLGLTTAQALAAKAANNVTGISTYPMMDFVQFKDPLTGNTIECTPLGHTLGIAASLDPTQDLGNKPVNGLSSVLGVVTPNGTPLQGGEMKQRADNGIGYITNQMPRQGNLIGTAHGRNASNFPGSSSATTGVNYTTTMNMIAKAFFASLGPYVDELQDVDPTDALDPTRRAVLGSLRTYLKALKRQGRISAFQIYGDQTNNTSASIAAGFLNVYAKVVFLATVRYIVPTLEGGTTVVLATSSNLSSASQYANNVAA